MDWLISVLTGVGKLAMDRPSRRYQAVQVLPVLLDNVAAAQAEQRGEHPGLTGRHGARLRHPPDQRLDRIARDELRQEEVDGQRDPRGDQVKAKLTSHIAQRRYPSLPSLGAWPSGCGCGQGR